VYIGTPSQPIKLVFDTGSDWLVAESSKCPNCHGLNFDEERSSTYTKRSKSVTTKEYGSAKLKGYESTDKVCLDSEGKDFCVKDFQWFLVMKQKGIGKKIDGVIGMCRYAEPPDVDQAPGPLFIPKLYQQGRISQNLFAFYMESFKDEVANNRPSFIDVGQYRDQNIRTGSTLVWFPLDKHFFWMNKRNTALRIGKDMYHYADEVSHRIIFDSGTSITLVPTTIFEKMMDKLILQMQKDAHIWLQDEGKIYVTRDCDDYTKWPSIDILVESHWLQIHPKDYLLDASKKHNQSSCEIGFMKNSAEFWLLGDAFYRGYYVIHDDANDRVGIAPHSNSVKRDIEERKGSKYPGPQIDKSVYWADVKLGSEIVGVSVMVLGTGLLLWKCVWPMISKKIWPLK